MPRFIYTLKDGKGRDYQGVIQARDRKEAQERLDTTGYYLISLKKELQLKSLFLSKKVSREDIIIFSRQLATMIETGLPIVKSLMSLAEQSDNYALRRILYDIGSDIEGGSSFSDAIAKYPKAFSDFYISMVRAGETGGILDKILKRTSVYLEKEEELNRKIKSAFAYPTIVSIIAIGVVSYLVVFVVPIFQEVYGSMKAELPVPTIVLIAISGFARRWWLQLLIMAAGLILGFRIFKRTEKGGFLIDKFNISIPIFGSLNKKVTVSRFVRSFGSLIASGIPITKGLNIAEAIAANKIIAKAIDKIRMAVNRGENISGSLKTSKIFPAVVVQLVATGEESGTLDTMLDKSADFLDEDIDTVIKGLTVKLEPMLTITLAIIVGFIALAIYLPMFDIIRSLSGAPR